MWMRTGWEGRATQSGKHARCRARVGLIALIWVTLAAPALPDPIADSIRTLLDGSSSGSVRVAGVALLRAADARAFYSDREYAPVWLDVARPAARATELRALLASAADEGLDARSFHLLRIDTLLASRVPSNAERAQLDVLLTDAFLGYAHALATGRIDPRAIHPHWPETPRFIDAVGALERVLAGERPRDVLERLRPPYAEYARLRIALARYRTIAFAGGWPSMPARVRLEAGDSGTAVVALRRRLAVETGGVPHPSNSFDAALDRALRDFQHTHGLEVDGIVGPRTRAALDVPAEERVAQLERELERWRWRADPGDRLRIEVSIPAFELQAVAGDSVVLGMRVITGRPDWPTPIFGATIRSIILSPYWNVPSRIAALEVLPAVRRDPRYLARNHMRVVTAGGRVIDAAAIDWASVRASTFAYRFRQDPGPDNPLGAVKFSLPNRFDVYLHDTSAPSLFQRTDRALSHGCIRIAKPLELAELLLRDRPGWTRQTLLDAIAHGRQREVRLTDAVPVAIRYHTAWVEADGTVHFRDDVYGHDARLAALLAGRRTVAGTGETFGGGCAVESPAG